MAKATIVLTALAVWWWMRAGQHHPIDAERRLVQALDNYCVPIEHRDPVCWVTLPQGFGE